MWALCERTQCSQLYFSQTLCCLHPKLNSGAWRHNKGFLRGGPAAAGLSPLFFLSRWSGIRLRRWVHHYLGPVSMLLRWVAFSRAWAAVLGLGVWLNSSAFGGCWVGAILGWLELAAELERLGRKCHIAWDDFCAAVKRSAKPSTAGPNRPVGETGESRKEILSAYFISVRFNLRWRSSTTRLAMDLPITSSVILVARRARSVALRSSLKAAGFGLDSSIERRSFAWNTCRTATKWSAEAACPADEKARPERAEVVLHGLDGWAAFAFQPMAMGRQRCTDSSRGGDLRLNDLVVNLWE